MLSESLRAVIAQQLIKTRDGGRCAANEILIGSTALSNMIREGKISQIGSILQTGIAAGMQSMDSHLSRLVKENKITKESAYEKAIDKSIFYENVRP
jgi:twitching motility protein PilT